MYWKSLVFNMVRWPAAIFQDAYFILLTGYWLTFIYDPAEVATLLQICSLKYIALRNDP